MTTTQQLFEDWQPHHQGRLVAMIEVAFAAGNKTLEHFLNRGIEVQRKGDNSPVTIADQQAEQLTRELIAERYPDDTIAGEEFAIATGSNDYRWTVDPIDGTKSFICGVPLYSTLLALEHNDRPIGGVILLPALGQAVVAALGHGCFHCDRDAMSGGNWKPAKVSERDQLADAVFVTSEVGSFGKRDARQKYHDLERECFLSRTWGDGYGYAMVATGRADIMVDPICNAWDVAAIEPILIEAGGKFTDWKGVATVRGGEGIGTNGKLHDQVLKYLN